MGVKDTLLSAGSLWLFPEKYCLSCWPLVHLGSKALVSTRMLGKRCLLSAVFCTSLILSSACPHLPPADGPSLPLPTTTCPAVSTRVVHTPITIISHHNNPQSMVQLTQSNCVFQKKKNSVLEHSVVYLLKARRREEPGGKREEGRGGRGEEITR